MLPNDNFVETTAAPEETIAKDQLRLGDNVQISGTEFGGKDVMKGTIRVDKATKTLVFVCDNLQTRIALDDLPDKITRLEKLPGNVKRVATIPRAFEVADSLSLFHKATISNLPKLCVELLPFFTIDNPTPQHNLTPTDLVKMMIASAKDPKSVNNSVAKKETSDSSRTGNTTEEQMTSKSMRLFSYAIDIVTRLNMGDSITPDDYRALVFVGSNRITRSQRIIQPEYYKKLKEAITCEYSWGSFNTQVAQLLVSYLFVDSRGGRGSSIPANIVPVESARITRIFANPHGGGYAWGGAQKPHADLSAAAAERLAQNIACDANNLLKYHPDIGNDPYRTYFSFVFAEHYSYRNPRGLCILFTLDGSVKRAKIRIQGPCVKRNRTRTDIQQYLRSHGERKTIDIMSTDYYTRTNTPEDPGRELPAQIAVLMPGNFDEKGPAPLNDTLISTAPTLSLKPSMMDANGWFDLGTYHIAGQKHVCLYMTAAPASDDGGHHHSTVQSAISLRQVVFVDADMGDRVNTGHVVLDYTPGGLDDPNMESPTTGSGDGEDIKMDEGNAESWAGGGGPGGGSWS